MKDRIKNLFFLHIILLLYSMTGVLSKLASGQPVFSMRFFYLYGAMLVILMLYAVLWQQAIKKMSIVVAYANKAVTVIWGIVWGMFIFREEISTANVIGTVIIIVGVVIMSGEEEENK